MYITANIVPQRWAEYQISVLKKAIGDTPIVSVSKQPMDLGTNIVESNPRRYWAIYQAMYLAAQAATTPYVAQVEDDVLYSHEHFSHFRPPDMNTVSYNMSRWSLFAWEKNPIYCLRQRVSNATLIAPRELLIEALKERFDTWPNGAPESMVGEVGREKIDKMLGVKHRKMVTWYSKVPVIHLNHSDGIDLTHGELKAIDIPYWGKASNIARIYNESRSRKGA
jgi:hypothetical protein